MQNQQLKPLVDYKNHGTFVTVEETITISKNEYKKLLEEREKFRLELEQIKKMIFGSKSERFVSSDPDQLKLFNEQKKLQDEAEEVEVNYKRKKNKGKAKRTVELPSHLRRETQVIEPELPEGTAPKKIGVEVTEILEYIPGEMYVHRTERPKYIVKTKDESGEEQEKAIIAELPTQVISKGNAGASLLAYILSR